jgi:hypothetical protein
LTTEQAARDDLESMLSWEHDPALTAEEVTRLLNGARTTDADGEPPDSYVTWLPARSYALGAEVVPVVRNEHYYAVTIAGTSGSVEPVWPTATGSTVVDGGVTWAEAGSAYWNGAWNLPSAAAKGWRIKAGRSASMVNWSAEGLSLSRNDIMKNCLEMAKRYGQMANGGIQNVEVAGSYVEWPSV